MKIVLILASTVMLASAQYFDQIAMESGAETSPQYAAYADYAVPVQQQQQVVYQSQPQPQQVVYEQQPQQVYYSPAAQQQQTYTVPLQAQAYVAPPQQILTQQNYISQSDAPTVVKIPNQVQKITQYSAPVAIQETYAAAPLVETYNSPPAIVRLRENYSPPENNQVVQTYANDDASYGPPPPQEYGAPASQEYGAPAPQEYGAPAPQEYGAPAPQEYGAPVSQEYGAPPALAKLVSKQVVYKKPVTVLKEVNTEYGAPEYIAPSGFPATQIKGSSANYGPPGYTPPSVVETYAPSAQMTDTYYGSPPVQDDSILKISQSLISEDPVQSYGPPEEIRQLYGVPEEPKEHKHIYVHTAPQEAYAPKVRILQPYNQQPEKHYQIIFVRAPSAQAPVRTEIQLPPPPVQKTLVYVLTKTPESNHEVKISAPVPTKPSKPEIYFIRYAANALNSGYGSPVITAVPSGTVINNPPRVSYSAPGGSDTYAPQMSYNSYSTNAGYRKREATDIASAVKEEQSEKTVETKVEETQDSKSE